MPPLKQVLLLDSGAAREGMLRSALAKDIELTRVASTHEAVQLASTRRFDLLIAEQGLVSGDFLEQFETQAPGTLRLLLVQDPEALVAGDDLSADNSIALVSVEGDDWLNQVRTLLYPRQMERQRLSGRLELEVHWVGGDLPLVTQVIDISNRGLSFDLTLDDDLEPVLPGTQLKRILIRRGSTVVGQYAGVVRHVERHALERVNRHGGKTYSLTTGPGYRVGVEFT